MPAEPLITRRELLGSAAAVAAWTRFGSPLRSEASPGTSAGQIGVLVDTTRCIGCRACVRACSQANDLPASSPLTTVWDGGVEALTYGQWTVVNLEDGTSPGAPVPVKRQCMHCLEPACVSVCPVGALHRLPSGAVVYRKERCIGCRYCVFACPFGIPKFQWDSGLTPVVGKCQFCAQGPVFTGPACAATCPTGALKFGDREALLFEAKARIHGRPDRYVNHIYGEREAGGTSWLYLASRPFQRLGFAKRVPMETLPALTRKALQGIPAIVTVLAVALSALAFLFRRQERLTERGA
jgi:formate dehydrogenase iron-sulfur subunit